MSDNYDEDCTDVGYAVSDDIVLEVDNHVDGQIRQRVGTRRHDWALSVFRKSRPTYAILYGTKFYLEDLDREGRWPTDD